MIKKNWIEESQEDAKKVFAPKIDYDKEDDILTITWLPQEKVEYSIESGDYIVFDISEKKNIVGIEIFDFMKKLNSIKQKQEVKKNE